MNRTLFGNVTRRSLLQSGIAAVVLSGILPDAQAAVAKEIPTLWLIGDSTMKVGTKDQQGWGDPVAQYFDPTEIRVMNRGRGGRSNRTFLTEKLWDAVLSEIKPGDFVVMQFGHNDGGPMDSGRARASIHDNSDDTKEVTIQETGVKETVHSYGWYLRRYITDAQKKGATPIVLSPVPRNSWGADGTVNRAAGDYGKWAMEAAKQTGAVFINFNEIIAKRYESNLPPARATGHRSAPRSCRTSVAHPASCRNFTVSVEDAGRPGPAVQRPTMTGAMRGRGGFGMACPMKKPRCGG